MFRQDFCTSQLLTCIYLTTLTSEICSGYWLALVFTIDSATLATFSLYPFNSTTAPTQIISILSSLPMLLALSKLILNLSSMLMSGSIFSKRTLIKFVDVGLTIYRIFDDVNIKLFKYLWVSAGAGLRHWRMMLVTCVHTWVLTKHFPVTYP